MGRAAQVTCYNYLNEMVYQGPGVAAADAIEGAVLVLFQLDDCESLAFNPFHVPTDADPNLSTLQCGTDCKAIADLQGIWDAFGCCGYHILGEGIDAYWENCGVDMTAACSKNPAPPASPTPSPTLSGVTREGVILAAIITTVAFFSAW